jgi:hypothetical protein
MPGLTKRGAFGGRTPTLSADASTLRGTTSETSDRWLNLPEWAGGAPPTAAPFMADLLGMRITTAVTWGQTMKRDWYSFVAAKIEGQHADSGARDPVT